MANRILQEIDRRELCRLFNEGQYWERTRTGELSAVVLANRHPSTPKAQEPYCTRSQMISYRRGDGHEVARVHQYLRPDQTIGASGRPDPKIVLHEGVHYVAEKP